MGMDLFAKNPKVEAPSYNWSGWRALGDFLARHGCNVELAGSNDGDVLGKRACAKIAATIEAHAAEYNEIYAGGYHGKNPAKTHAAAFRASGGVRQF